MPRYFVTTSDGFQATDEDGVVMPDVAALRRMLCQTLSKILHDEGCDGGESEFWAEAIDEAGESVLKLKVSVTRVDP